LDLDDGFAFCLEMAEQDGDDARRRFGNLTRIREDTREQWRFTAMESLAADGIGACRHQHQQRHACGVRPKRRLSTRRAARVDAGGAARAVRPAAQRDHRVYGVARRSGM
jgi:hypothetical protein